MINVVLGITQFDVKFDLRQEISAEIFHFSIEGLRYLDESEKANPWFGPEDYSKLWSGVAPLPKNPSISLSIGPESLTLSQDG